MTPQESLRQLAYMLDSLESSAISPSTAELVARYGEELVGAAASVTQRYLKLLAKPSGVDAPVDDVDVLNIENSPSKGV